MVLARPCDRQLVAARAAIEQEMNRARAQLRGEVASIAVAGAGQVLGREIDDAAHAKLLDDLVSQL